MDLERKIIEILLFLFTLLSWIAPVLFFSLLLSGLKKLRQGENYARDRLSAAISLTIPFSTFTSTCIAADLVRVPAGTSGAGSIVILWLTSLFCPAVFVYQIFSIAEKIRTGEDYTRNKWIAIAALTAVLATPCWYLEFIQIRFTRLQ